MSIVYDGSQLSTTEEPETTTTTESTTTTTPTTTITAILSTITTTDYTTNSPNDVTNTTTITPIHTNTTHYPPPPNFHYKNGSNMGEPNPEATAYGVVTCISVGVLVIMLYMSLFGRRIKWTAIRWHVLNCSLWGLLHLGSYSSFAENAPFPNWIKDKEWRDKKAQVECFTRSVFPAGMFFVFIEQMILTCVPKLADKTIFNLIFGVLMIPVVNGLMIFCFAAQYIDYPWFYNPIDLFNLVSFVLFTIMTFVYFLFCLLGSCCCCFVIASKKQRSQSASTFVDMWLLFPYALIPNIMYGPSFGITSVGFVMQNLMSYLMSSGLMEAMMGGGGSSAEEGGGLPIDMATILDIMTTALQALPWFVLFFPLVQSVLTIVCISSFRQQFFFLITCGRCYSNSECGKGDEAQKQWTLGGIAPFPVYPKGSSLEPIKMDNHHPDSPKESQA